MACEGRGERSTLAMLPGPFGLVLVSGFIPFLSRPVPIGIRRIQACIPLARGTGDRFPTGGLIALCTNASLAVGWQTGERGQVTAFRLSGLQDRPGRSEARAWSIGCIFQTTTLSRRPLAALAPFPSDA